MRALLGADGTSGARASYLQVFQQEHSGNIQHKNTFKADSSGAELLLRCHQAGSTFDTNDKLEVGIIRKGCRQLGFLL